MKPLSFSEVNQRGPERCWFIFHVNHYDPLEITNAALYRCNALTLAAGPVAGNPRVMLGREGEVYRERWLTDPSLAASLWSRDAWTHTHTHTNSTQQNVRKHTLHRVEKACQSPLTTDTKHIIQ